MQRFAKFVGLFAMLFVQLAFARSICFIDYPVKVYEGPHAPINFESNPNAAVYKTQLESVANQEPNFAGHYVLTMSSCGNLCQEILLYDVKSGAIYFPKPYDPANKQNKNLIGWTVKGFMPYSNLLMVIANRIDNSNAVETGQFHQEMLYYKWENNHLIFLQKHTLDYPT